MIAALRRWLASGTDGLAPIPAKYVRQTNTVAAVVGATLAIYVPILALIPHPAAERYVWINLTEALLFFGVVWLNRLRMPHAATAAMLSLGWSLLVAAGWTFGTKVGVHHYLIALAVAPALLTGPGQQWLTVLFALLGMGSYLMLEQFGNPDPAVGPPFDAAVVTWFSLANRAGLFLFLLAVAWWIKRTSDRTEADLERERERSESLLLSILPAPVAARLKAGSRQIADDFSEVTVLFADIVGFTELAARYRPEQVLDILNELFATFDALADRYGIEKIKTIGDAYMAAAGVPEPRPDHAEAAAEMALAMVEAAGGYTLPDGSPVRVRVGLSSGPVVAGIIGEKRFSYDLWGDTVNTASRMESHGHEDRIQVDEDTQRRLRDRFRLEPRGAVEIKGKGRLNTWFLTGRQEDPAQA